MEFGEKVRLDLKTGFILIRKTRTCWISFFQMTKMVHVSVNMCFKLFLFIHSSLRLRNMNIQTVGKYFIWCIDQRIFFLIYAYIFVKYRSFVRESIEFEIYWNWFKCMLDYILFNHLIVSFEIQLNWEKPNNYWSKLYY